MSENLVMSDTFDSFINKDIEDNYTKRLVNKVIDKLLGEFSDDFFMLYFCAEIVDKEMLTYKFNVEDSPGDIPQEIILSSDVRKEIHAICMILNTYNKNFEKEVAWNKISISLHYSGSYSVQRKFHEDINKKYNKTIRSNVVDFFKIKRMPRDTLLEQR